MGRSHFVGGGAAFCDKRVVSLVTKALSASDSIGRMRNPRYGHTRNAKEVSNVFSKILLVPQWGGRAGRLQRVARQGT